MLRIMVMILMINSFNSILTAAGYSVQLYDNYPGGILFRICPSGRVVSQIKR